ncbi:penicillin-binding protein 1A [Oricola cellulosilytica]|uniref:Penicillin-binding protein 1A n=1 Tax=Oricola cellulosilytica TaxID=1429082 RepID=A0A4R0PDJ5_9HYPH|nr:penicillin-binding protein 1A [Oricola cellulosilytica]TCD14633.1 penicillin-binding protein 1A [Oricola cellulosilytica]
MLRLLGYFFGIATVLFLLVAGGVVVYIGGLTKDMPDYEVLSSYEPPVTTRVYSSDGQLMGEFARQKRLYLPIQAVPDRVKAAFLSAEDKNFYHHRGVDFVALARAMVTNLENYQSGRRLVGASTITQQVAKNFLLTNDRTIDRKIREAILAFRIEQAYSKDRILELYLNEIFFGSGAYGIAGAALTYFGKSVNELNIQEAAYLAALPKAPSNYHPFDDTEAAITRRNWIVDRMLDNGYVTREEADAAKAEPLGVNFRRSGDFVFASEYFTEEVRKEIIDRYGNDALYEGGLSVRTTLDPALQVLAREALHNGLIDYDRKRGYRGPVARIDVAGDWGVPLADVERLSDVPEWQLAAVLSIGEQGAELGLQPKREISGRIASKRETVTLAAENAKWAFTRNEDGKVTKVKSLGEVVAPGDVVYVEDKGDAGVVLQQVPEVSGALVSMDPNTGRVLAMAGGFSFSDSQFNRATQAYRQPGSAFKPFVYAAALDNGYTPASVVMDAPISITSGNDVWEPKNYGGGFAGPSTLRLGIEKSRNLMTVRLARDMGMPIVAEYAERFGIYDDMLPVLAMALGSGETTVLRMVSAYSVIANGGRSIEPSLIDRVQDRYGRTVYRHDQRGCEGCNASQWLQQDEPQLVDNREQVLDPMTAFQITSMMEGVVQRGTATLLRELGRPLAGKTGTTNDEKDAWFIGFTPNMVTGVYIGYDQPTPMGRGSTGGQLAAPVFKEFMAAALEGQPIADFRLPDGMNVVEIDRKTGMRSSGGDTILEAFKPGTGPADSYQVIGIETVAIQAEEQRRISPRAQEAIQSGQGGLF